MFVRFLFIASVYSPFIRGQSNPYPLSQLIDNLVGLVIAESLGVSDQNAYPYQTPNYEENVLFRLFTREMYAVGMDVQANPDSLLRSPMDPNVPTKIFVFGFDNQFTTEPAQELRNAYLGKGDYNFVVVDWSQLAKGIDYPKVRSYVGGVANVTAKFLDALVESKICLPKDQHIIGHSIGAHIAGMASRVAKTKPGRCTGLDPAGPLFELSSTDGRIDSSVATLVDIIHTCAGFWGLAGPVGHIDFYPNGGTWPQPDCFESEEDIDGFCSHTMSYHYFSRTILHPTLFLARRCQSSSIIRGLCPDSSDIAVLGEHIVFDVPGLYYLDARINLTDLYP